MKPEEIKCILRSYLKEKEHSSAYDDIDGFSYAPPEHMSDLMYMEFQPANLPLDELNAPLEHELEVIAVGIGRQLSEMSDEFELDHAEAINNQTPANGIQFREHIIRVPPNNEFIQIPVVRDGSANGEVKVEWRTCDRSAKAGLHYVNSQGNISFAEGEEEKTIEIKLIKDQEKKTDICFAVELIDDRRTFNTLMIYIDDSKLYPEEQRIIENIFSARHISLSEIVSRLSDKVTHNTFKAALQCLCSNAETIPKELALASELLRLTLPHARLSTLTNVFFEFFSGLPDLEEVAALF
ncbi:hypothetical protein HNY73_019123 [Argiope bruennichi]|uniref:Calx-beta domain-containing protein n=1 Tax=Argiope bruennichi TaxID=94029 RepID=A0A8T0EFF9_ARGBR|nr:hypothetical protein HNY73_019123 [Argiope bruennichi]